MRILGWKVKFEESVLERGEKHFHDEDVDRLRLDNGKLKAIVFDDSDIHDVEITLNGDRVSGMHCSCNDDWFAKPCSHMAAVLYAAESGLSETSEDELLPDEESSDEDDADLERADDFIDVLNSLTEVQAKSILRHLAMTSDEIRRSLMLRFSEKMEPDMVIDIRGMISDAYEELDVDQYGFMTGNFLSYERSIRNIFEKFIPRFLKNGLIWEAFEITVDAMDSFGCSLLEFENEDIYKVCSCIGEFWKDILSSSDENTREKILKYIAEYELDESYNLSVSDYAFRFRNELSKDNEYQKAIFNERVEWLNEDNSDDYEDWLYDNAYERTCLYVIQMLVKGLGTEEDLDDFVELHSDSRKVNDLILGVYEENNLREKKLELLLLILNGSNLNKQQDKLYTQNELAQMVKEAYHLMFEFRGKEEAVKFLENEVCEKHRMVMTEDIFALKEVVSPEKWHKLKKKMIKEIYKQNTPLYKKHFLLGFMIEEGEFNSAFNALQKCKFNIETFNMFSSKLVAYDEEKCFMTHFQILDLEMKSASNRKLYAAVISELENVKLLYPDGEMKASGIADSWKDKYGQRISMLEELSKAGY